MSNSELSEHLKVHPQCQCGQYFAPKIFKEHSMKCSKLKQRTETIFKHIKINSDEPGLCNACGKKCETLESLTRHIRIAGHVLCPFCTDLLPYDASPSHILKCQVLTGEQQEQFSNCWIKAEDCYYYLVYLNICYHLRRVCWVCCLYLLL